MAHLEIIRPAQLSRWQRFKRSLTLGPFNPKDREIARYFGGSPVVSGVSVNEETMMSSSAVWAAVNLVSAHISSVPLVLFKVLPDGGKERFVGHPLYRLVHDRPNPLMGSAIFRRTMQANKMVWGESFAEIERDFTDRPKNLWPLLSQHMSAFFEGGQLFYRYRNPGGVDVIFDPEDIIHLRSHSENGINGCSVVSKGRESFGLAIAAERFGAAFYGNGSTMDGVIEYPAGINVTPQAKEDNRKALSNRHQGVDRAYRMLALYEGAKYSRLGVEPNQAQFLETRMFQVEEVARWFNIPPHKLKHLQRTSYNSIEHQSIEYVTDALDPDWVLWEQELNLKLVSPLEMNQQRIEHIREGMLRGDSASRSELQSKQFSIASVTPNEVRQMENRNPIHGGDQSFVALNLIPMDLARPYWEAQIEKAKEPKVVAPPSKSDGDGGERAILELKEQLTITRGLLQSAEDARDVAVVEAAKASERAELVQVAREMAEGTLAVVRSSLENSDRAVEALAAEKASAEDALEQATRCRREADERVVAAHAERDVALEMARGSGMDTAQAMQQAAAAEAERDTALALAAEQRANDQQQMEMLAAGNTVLQKQVVDLDAELAEAVVSLSFAQAAVKDAENVAAEAETLRAELARARADIAAELDTQQKQRAVTLAAMRSLFVDASERLLTKESLAARKHQATAAKLRAWVDTFYPMHVETVRGAFRPAVAAWSAVTGGEPGPMLERLVAGHMSESRGEFLWLLEYDDDDERAALLERTLRSWEDERADAMADAVVREGMAQ